MLLDALGTLLELEPPAPRLAEHLGVPLAHADAAVAKEIAYYRANLHRGGDGAGLAALRRDCARLVAEELGIERDVEAELLESIVFRPFPEVPGVLRELREDGWRLVVCSNWDVSLHEALATTGLRELVDGAVSSAEIGVAKPDPALFRHALSLAGADGGWHVGDDLEADVAGARAAGLRAVFVARAGRPPAGVASIASLAELPQLLSSH